MSKEKLTNHLQFLYGDEVGTAVTDQLMERLTQFQARHPQLAQKKKENGRFSQRDIILITYGDMVQDRLYKPLQTLGAFLKQHLAGKISTIHLLPFYPYSSDDGFSVTDYTAVDPHLGEWQHINTIGQTFHLMLDAVINHISAQSGWFNAFVNNDPHYKDYFITVDPDINLSHVFRPRALPLLTPVQTAESTQYVWTTFSADQVDLNYANPDVLLDVLDVLLLYVANGAQLIRLDAVAFLWKDIDTDCIHLPQTHEIIKLIRTLLNIVAPHVALITETNVPHDENISYFGDGDEAQMVYNFTLPPLTLHAFHTGSAKILCQWAATLSLPSDQVTFFNFLASHDGIGLLPASEILPSAQIRQMAERVQALGGFVSYKINPDGSRSPYELNINYLDALSDPAQPDEDVEFVAQRFLASQAIMLALQGIPGIYFHSLFGSHGWQEGVQETGRYRTINRQKLDRQQITLELANPRSLRYHVFYDYMALLRHRTSHAAFHPNAAQRVIFCHEAVFAVERTAMDGRSQLLCLTNVSNQPLTLTLERHQLPQATTFTDLISSTHYQLSDQQTLPLNLTPYQILWLSPD